MPSCLLLFRKSIVEYSAEVANMVTNVSITAVADRSEDSVTILPTDAEPHTDGHQVALSEGANTITITVTPSNTRIPGRTYTLTVRRSLSSDNTLRNLTMSNATLSPLPFRSNITYYTATVAHNVASTTITAEANHAEASVSISPQDADTETEGHQVALTESYNTIPIIVTAADGIVQNYYLDVWVEDDTSDNALGSLTLNNATLSPGFHGNTTNYTANVGQASAVTTVTARANHSMARTVILPADADGETSGHQVDLIEGINPITIVVIAPDGTSRIYKVSVTRTPHSVVETSLISQLSLNDRQMARDVLLPSTPSTKAEVRESRLLAVEASSEGLRFVFLVADSVKDNGFTVEARSSLKTGQWQVLREGVDCIVSRKDNEKEMARVTVILPSAEEDQMFLRLMPKHQEPSHSHPRASKEADGKKWPLCMPP